jgi:hypothetical protein
MPHNTATTIFISKDNIPEEGGELWIGIQPNWYADYGGFTCGFRWPWMDGQGNSAQCYVNLGGSYTWQSYDTGADEWGSSASDDDTGAWFEGNLLWYLTGPDTADYGFDGNHLYVTAPAGGTTVVSATLPGEDEQTPPDDNDDAMGAPWTLPSGVAMKARCKVTTAGDTSEAGERYLRFRWASGRDLITGEVKLGDQNYDEGILLYDSDGTSDDNSNYVAKSFTNSGYFWVMIDARNPEYLTAKLWDEGDGFGSGQPAKHDIRLETGDTSENPVHRDYFEITMSGGNMTGADQTIQVDTVLFCGSGEDCDWVEEYMGIGDGETYRFYTAQPYKPSSLWLFVDGFHVRAVTEDYVAGQFRSNYSLPAAVGANMVARYLVDENPAGD